MDTVLAYAITNNTFGCATSGCPLVSLEQQEASAEIPTPEIFSSFYDGRLFPIELDEREGVEHPPRKTKTFRLDLAYRGSSFCGWQNQGNAQTILPAVQEAVEQALDGRNVRVAGRTDAGVHAFAQVACVRTGLNVDAVQLQSQLEQVSTSEMKDHGLCRWKCWRVVRQSSQFHPTFDAKSRSYVYILDGLALSELFRDEADRCQSTGTKKEANVTHSDEQQSLHSLVVLQQIAFELNRLFRPLVGRPFDYVGLSHGKVKTDNTICFVSHLRAIVARRHTTSNCNERTTSGDNETILVVELTANRFLRRQIRILLATALMQVASVFSTSSARPLASDVEPNTESLIIKDTTPRPTRACKSKEFKHEEPNFALVRIVEARNRSLSAHAAPPDGLIFVGAQF
ncbi:hypothetical protein ACA910_009403 [Epithemia clementina (nom. ined.)]